MTRKKKKAAAKPPFRAAVIALGASLLCAAAVSAYLYFRPLRAVLIGLDAAEKAAIERVFADAGLRASLEEAPAGTLPKRLSSLLPPDLVFARSGLELNRSRDALEKLPDSLVRRVPQSLAWAVTERSDARSLPILVDHFEIAWRLERWEKRDLKEPRSRADFDKAAAAFIDPRSPSVLFAGGDAETLLLALSAVCVSQKGVGGYRSAVGELTEWAFEAKKADAAPRPISELFGRNAPLADAAAELKRWKTAGYLHSEWDRLSPADVRTFMESGIGNIVLQPLSFHRTVPYSAIADYRSRPFPRFGPTDRPALVAPMTTVSVPSRGLRVGRSLEAAAAFANAKAGFLLAETSGRATAIAAAQAPDVQAADALAWAAAHRYVVSGFYRDAFYESAAAEAFAAALRASLR